MWYRFPHHHSHQRMAWVGWRPPQRHLHYPELYVSICEYLRVPPCHSKRLDAEAYLADLQSIHIPHFAPVYQLQRDRIEWTQAWLRAVWQEEAEVRIKKQRIN